MIKLLKDANAELIADIKFAKVQEDAIIPTKREEDAGFDIYTCFVQDFIQIQPHKTVLIPTGIASSCDPNFAFILRERGSTGSKGLGLRAGVIDSGYRNEWFIGITNHNDFSYYIVKKGKEDECKDYYQAEDNNLHIYPYEKAIAQCLIVPVPKVKAEEISYDELKNISSERGMGALGSSNK